MNEKERCLRTVQSLEFALVELGLCLDSHPDCKEALAQYKNFNAQHEQAKNQYEMHFGPLTAGSTGNTDYWDWVATPFPWEIC